MKLTWDEPADDAESVTGYRILRRNPDVRRNLRTLVENTLNTLTTYIDTTVTNGKRWVYRVLALRGEEVSRQSDYANKTYRRPATATPTPTPTPTPTATATATPTATATSTPTATATPRTVNRRSLPPPRIEKVTPTPETVDPPIARQEAAEDPRILVQSPSSGSIGILIDAGDELAQEFTTGFEPSRLTSVTLQHIGNAGSTELIVTIREADSDGNPGEVLHALETPTTASTEPVFTAPENAELAARTKYFVHITRESGFSNIRRTSDPEETEESLPDWTIDDNSLEYHGNQWKILTTERVVVMTLMGVVGEEAVPDRESMQTSSAVSLGYSRSAGESPYVSATIDDADDIDWFYTGLLSIDAGARYRIDIRPSSPEDSLGLRLRAFYTDYAPLRSEDDFVELEEVADPEEGVFSYYVRPTRHSGPYLEVYDLHGTTGDYEIRFVNDPEMTWDGTELLDNDLPADDTTWATLVVDDDMHVVGVYNYFDDHDWLKVELVAEENYVFVTAPPDDWLTTPDVGTVIRLFNSDGDQLAITYGNSRVVVNEMEYTIPAGEGGTYYVDVSYANFNDDPDFLAILGLTEGFETGASPFIGSRYRLQVNTRTE